MKHIFISFTLFIASFVSLHAGTKRVTVLKHPQEDQYVAFFWDKHDEYFPRQTKKMKKRLRMLDKECSGDVEIFVEGTTQDEWDEVVALVRQKERILKKLLKDDSDRVGDDRKKKLSLGLKELDSFFTKNFLSEVQHLALKNISITNVDSRLGLGVTLHNLTSVILINRLKGLFLYDLIEGIVVESDILNECSASWFCKKCDGIVSTMKTTAKCFSKELQEVVLKDVVAIEEWLKRIRVCFEGNLEKPFVAYSMALLIDAIDNIMKPIPEKLMTPLDYNVLDKLSETNANAMVFAGALHCENTEIFLDNFFGWEVVYEKRAKEGREADLFAKDAPWLKFFKR